MFVAIIIYFLQGSSSSSSFIVISTTYLSPLSLSLSLSLSLFVLITPLMVFAKLCSGCASAMKRSFLVTDGQRWWSDLEICRTAVLPRDVGNSPREGEQKARRIENAEPRVFWSSSFAGVRPAIALSRVTPTSTIYA